MDTELLKQMYNSYSTEDILVEDDCFLLGDGNKDLLRGCNRSNTNRSAQLMGIVSVADLKSQPIESSTVEIEQDLDDFKGPEPTQWFENLIEDYFYKAKKETFDKFNYVEQKSKALSGRLIREVDLVITDDDKYLIHYLIGSGVTDNFLFDSLAHLSALYEMGFREVRFTQKDNCALCTAYDGNLYDIKSLISLLGSGEYLVHEFCACSFIPVIKDRAKTKVIVDREEVYIGETLVKNLPIEFEDELYSLIEKSFYKEVHFINFLDNDGWSHEVVTQSDNILYVHSGYLGNKSSFDYLKFWEENAKKSVKDSLSYSDEDLQGLDVFYFEGRKIVEIDGFYIDIETKEIVQGV